MQEDIDNVDVIPSLKFDHSAIVLSINGIENTSRGPSFWKLNSSSLDDNEYVSLMNTKYSLWNDELKEVQGSDMKIKEVLKKFNNLILFMKFYIYTSKMLNQSIYLSVFVNKVLFKYRIESSTH